MMLENIKYKYRVLLSDTRFSEILIGSIWALAARGFSAFFVLISSIIIARFYGVEMMGIVAVINSFLILASIMTVMGTNISIMRLIPEHAVKYSYSSALHVYHKALIIVIGSSVLIGTVFYLNSDIIASKLFKKNHLSTYFAMASVFIVFKALTELNTYAIRGLKLIRAFGVMQTLPQASNLFLLLLFSITSLSKNIPVYCFLSGFAVTGIVGFFILEVNFKKKCKSKDVVHNMPTSEIFSISIPMLMTASMVFIIGQTGVVMLGMYQSSAHVGYFDISLKLATIATVALTAVNAIAAPKFSELYHSDNIEELFYIAKKSTKLIFWTTAPIFLGLIVLGKQVLVFVFGREFLIAYPGLVILVIGQFVTSVSGATGFFMNMTGNQKVFRNIMIITALINIGLNYLLIQAYSIVGAAIASTISITFWNVTTLVFIKWKFGSTTGYFPGIFKLE